MIYLLKWNKSAQMILNSLWRYERKKKIINRTYIVLQTIPK